MAARFLYRRREFIALLGGAVAAWPLAARAEQAERRLIGVLMSLAAQRPAGSGAHRGVHARLATTRLD